MDPPGTASAPESPLSWIASHPLVGVAALASAAAGLVHAAAAGTHSADRVASLVFAVTAVLQVGWAFFYVARPTRIPAAAGMALNASVALSWALSRTIGLPFPEALSGVEHASMQDGVAALLGVTAAVCAALAAWRPQHITNARGSVAAVAGAGAVLFAVALPGIWATHGHGSTMTPTNMTPTNMTPGAPGGSSTPMAPDTHAGHGG